MEGKEGTLHLGDLPKQCHGWWMLVQLIRNGPDWWSKQHSKYILPPDGGWTCRTGSEYCPAIQRGRIYGWTSYHRFVPAEKASCSSTEIDGQWRCTPSVPEPANLKGTLAEEAAQFIIMPNKTDSIQYDSSTWQRQRHRNGVQRCCYKIIRCIWT